jgi:hypothetical protein
VATHKRHLDPVGVDRPYVDGAVRMYVIHRPTGHLLFQASPGWNILKTLMTHMPTKIEPNGQHAQSLTT